MDLSALSRQLPEILSRKKQKVSRIFTVEEFIIYIGIQDLSFR